MPPKSTRRKNIRRKAPMRKRKGNRKARGPAKVGQMVTLNVNRPKPQVFQKTALNAASGASVTGTNSAVIILGGALASSMPDWANIIALYNRYKMLKVTYTFNIQGLGGVTLFNADMPKMLVRYNYDSNLLQANVLARLQEVPNVK